MSTLTIFHKCKNKERDNEFHCSRLKIRQVLSSHWKELAKQGKGNKENAVRHITPEDINHLFDTLMPKSNPFRIPKKCFPATFVVSLNICLEKIVADLIYERCSTKIDKISPYTTYLHIAITILTWKIFISKIFLSNLQFYISS